MIPKDNQMGGKSPKPLKKTSPTKAKIDFPQDPMECDLESSPSTLKDKEEEDLERLVFGSEALFGGTSKRELCLKGDKLVEDDEDDDDQVEGLELLDDAQLFFLDSGPALDSKLKSSCTADTEDDNAPPWEDSDDERMIISLARHSKLRKLRFNEEEDTVTGTEYMIRLRKQHEILNPTPPWAQGAFKPAKRPHRRSAASDTSMTQSDDDDDDDDDLELSSQPLAKYLQQAGSFNKATTTIVKQTKLRPEVLDIQQTRPIPLTQPSAVSSLSFHPEHPILLSSGLASTLYLHEIDPTAHPTPNPLITSVHVRNTPLHTSQFLYPEGDKIVFSGRRRYFHIWDLQTGMIEKVTRVYGQKDEQKSMEEIRLSPCGRYMALRGTSKKGGGIINILDAKSTQWIVSMRIEGAQGVADFAWWRNGDGLTVISKAGEVAEWAMESRAYVARWVDEGHAPTVLTLGGHGGPKSLGGDRWVVIGSQSGIINIYDRCTFVSPKKPNDIIVPEYPKPRKSFDQLTRPVSHLCISPDGQLLSFSSRWKKDALRLVHLPSCTVYRNWPTNRTPLGRITSVAFGAKSDLLAVGNETGKIHMWEIRA
ncbi:BgTH12-05946 [Blumeria graminis f. sp. triticale]|uniref:BgTH12-05946 n=1 Tax=Blumeria graminis f. sp. triticale TaxID=1689686 RepID=A0A9W4D963_BLUGR|nr:BgTH12-05946 [Blumeria graminis f. sp. triticale]